MLIYILKSAGCLAILFLFYKLFLENESMHRFKRYYLMASLIISLVIPAIVFTEYVEVPSLATNESVQPITNSHDVINVPAALEADIIDIEPMLLIIYFIGVFFFGIKFIKNLFQIFRRIRKNPKQILPRFIQVLHLENQPPHTFFKYIFLNRRKLEANEIPNEVLLHEETHARQKHSLDVVFVELLQVVLWFNPFVYLIKKAIKLNHEFLADQAVLENNIDKTSYQNTLLSYLSLDSKKKYQPNLANGINYSSIKKRFTIMKTKTSKKSALIRSLIIVPLLTLILYGFSNTKVVEIQQNQETVIPLEKKLNTVDTTLISKTIEININKNGQLLVQSDLVALKNLENYLSKINAHLSFEERKNTVRSTIIADTRAPINTVKEVDKILTEYGSATINIIEPNTKYLYQQKGASREQMKEYDKLAKHYNEMSSSNMRIYLKDVERLKYIYNLMNSKQKENAEPFPDFPEPPPAPNAPAPSKTLNSPVKPIPPSNPNSTDKNEGWNIATGAIRNSGKATDKLPIPPTAPTIAMHANTDSYSKELKTSINQYLEKNKAYEKAVADYRENQNGNPQNLWDSYDEAMKLYAAYYTISREEGNFIQPMPAFKERDKVEKDKLPAPPAPPSPLDHVIDMAKKNALFYYEGKEITSDKAIDLLKNNEHINIDTRGSKTDKPVVRLSTEPIIIKD